MFYSNKYPRSVFRELQDFPYNKKNRRAIFNSTKGSEDFVQRLKLYKKLPIHGGCVNCICWNDKGNKILSGSDDQHLAITDPFSYQVLTRHRTNHRANIFSAKFLPETGDSGIISCCGDGSILYTDLCRVDETQDCLFNCHSGTTYDVVTVPNDPHVFLSCGEDYTVRSFDLRIKNKCNKVKCKEDVIIECRRAVTALTVNSLLPYQIAIGCADSTARIYDRRMIHGFDCRLSATDAFIKPGLEKKPYRITSLNFSPEGDDLLVSYSSEHVYLFGVRNTKETVYSTESIIDSDEEETDSSWISRGDRGDSDQPVRRLRLRGDWSDTGPDARPHSNQPATANQSQGGRRVVQGGLIQRMTDVLSRMLNDPATRAALSQGGEPEPSDQVRLEEGLGEYLDINGRRRPSDGTATAPSEDSVAPSDVPTTQHTTPSESGLVDQSVSLSSDRDVEMEDTLVDTSPNDSARDMMIDSQQQDESGGGEIVNSSTNIEQNVQTAHPSHIDSYHDDDDDNVLPVKRVREEIEQCTNHTDSNRTDRPNTCSILTPLHSANTCDNLSSVSTCDTPSSVSTCDHLSSVSTCDNLSSVSTCDNPSSVASQLTTSESTSTSDVLQTSQPGSESSQSLLPTEPSNHSSSQSTVDSESQRLESSTPQPTQEGSSSGRSNPGVCLLRSSDLPDELSTMFNGFKQKYGKKPMVNLVYSMRGSTASTISMSVDDQQASTSTTIQPPQTEREDEDGRRNSRSFEESVTMEETNRNVTGETTNETPMESASSQSEPSQSAPSQSELSSGSTEQQSQQPSQPSTSSYSSTRFAVRMEKELCKAIRNARGGSNQDDTVRLKKANIRMTYTGHRNARTMIKESTFWGSDYVMSGSDCGHVFVWSRDTGRLVMTLQADNHVVNCLQPHPTLPILATSGIDYDVKLWAPLATEPYFDYPAAQELMNRNAIMLEETKDTITVPASFMIRMLACLNQLRRGGPRSSTRRRRAPDE